MLAAMLAAAPSEPPRLRGGGSRPLRLAAAASVRCGATGELVCHHVVRAPYRRDGCACHHAQNFPARAV